MRFKKTMSMVLSLAMIFSIFVFPASAEATATNTENTDEYIVTVTDGTKTTGYSTWENAVNAINASATSGQTITLRSNIIMGAVGMMPTKECTIDGAGQYTLTSDNDLYNGDAGAIYLHANTTFKNLTLSEETLYCQDYNLTIDGTVKTDYNILGSSILTVNGNLYCNNLFDFNNVIIGSGGTLATSVIDIKSIKIDGILNCADFISINGRISGSGTIIVNNYTSLWYYNDTTIIDDNASITLKAADNYSYTEGKFNIQNRSFDKQQLANIDKFKLVGFGNYKLIGNLSGNIYSYSLGYIILSGGNGISEFAIKGAEFVQYGDTNITVFVPHNTDVTALTPTFKIDYNATVSPAIGTVQNFTNPVTYTVTAENGTTRSYVVTVKKMSDTSIINAFSIGAYTGKINNTNHTVVVTVPYGTDVTALTPTVTVGFMVTVSPKSGTTMNFTNPVTYKVTGQDGIIQDYIVTIAVAANTGINGTTPSFANDLIPDNDPTSPNLIGKLCNDYAYIYGKDYKTMGPEDAITRCEASTLIYRLLKQNNQLNGYSKPSTPSFKDLKGDEWFDNSLEFMTYLGVYNKNCADDTIFAYRPITRGEAAKLFAFAMGISPTDPACAFTDLDTSNHYYKYINALAAGGYIQGDAGTNKVRPDDALTRAEFVVMPKIFLFDIK